MSTSKLIHNNTKVEIKQKKKMRKIRFYHSFLTIILLLCILVMGRSAFINLAKIVVYHANVIKAQNLKTQAENRNIRLKNEIKNFSSMSKVESIARNNLKMAAKDEVLIIINNHAQAEKEEQQISNNKVVRFFENFTSRFNKNIDDDSDNIF